MAPEPKDDAQRRLSLLTAALYAIGGVQVAFFPLWLGARGMSGAEIALILAACPAIRIPSHLIGTRLGDKYGDYGRLIVAYAAAVTAIFVVLGFVQGFYGLLFWVAALSFAQAPIGPLNDGLVLGEVHRRRALGCAPLNFSSVRGWGSASVLLFMLCAGSVADAIPASELIWIMTAISCFTTVAGFFLVRGLAAGRESESQSHVAPTTPLRRPLLIAAIIACAAIVHGSHGFLTVFASLHWSARGFDPTFISFAWAVSTFSEVLFFLSAGRWFGGETKAVTFLMVGSAGAVLRWAVYANDPSAAGVLFAQCLNPLSGSAIGLGAAYLIAELGGSEYTARVHGWLGAAYGVALTFGLYVSGPLEAAFGQRGYLAMSAMAGLGLAISFGVAAATRDGVLKEKRQPAPAACPEPECENLS